MINRKKNLLKILLAFCVTFSLWQLTVPTAVALPACTLNWHNCFGSLTYADGKYRGEWQNGKKHGVGTKIGKKGDTYSGEWENGKRHGKGIEERPDGYKYDGEWRNGKKHGMGVVWYPLKNKYQGGKYVGELENNGFNGFGMFFNSSKKLIKEGRFLRNELIETKTLTCNDLALICSAQELCGKKRKAEKYDEKVKYSAYINQIRYQDINCSGQTLENNSSKANDLVQFTLPIGLDYSLIKKAFMKLESANRLDVQNLLQKDYRYSGGIDGEWGPGTKASIKKYHEAKGSSIENGKSSVEEGLVELLSKEASLSRASDFGQQKRVSFTFNESDHPVIGVLRTLKGASETDEEQNWQLRLYKDNQCTKAFGLAKVNERAKIVKNGKIETVDDLQASNTYAMAIDFKNNKVPLTNCAKAQAKGAINDPRIWFDLRLL